jgi:D-alanine-D-alanine ligase
VSRADELAGAYRAAAEFDCEVFAERWASGREYTVAILHGEALPLVRIDAAKSFYDYQAKYFSDETRYVCPCGLDDEIEMAYREKALTAFRAVGAAGWGRVDFMLGTDDTPLFLEVNTVPGMTSHSLVPMAAQVAGMDFDELVWRILETSMGAVTGHLARTEAIGAC